MSTARNRIRLLGCALLLSVTFIGFVVSNRPSELYRIDSLAKAEVANEESFVTTSDVEYLFREEQSEYVRKTIKSMTLEEKIGQLFMWRIRGTTVTAQVADQLKKVHAGGVILMGDNISKDTQRLSQELQKLSPNMPLFVAVDQEGGVVKRVMDDPNPGARTLGAKSNHEVCNTFAHTSELLSAQGINVNFGIVADVAYRPDSFIAERSFGSTPELVNQKVIRAVRCTYMTLSTVKHFPGHGRTTFDSHKTIPEIDMPESEWMNTDAIPFEGAIRNGIDFVMNAHIRNKAIEDSPATLSPKQVALIRKLGFRGIIVTDDMGMLEKSGYDTKQAMVAAFQAGNDLLLDVSATPKIEDIYQYMLDSVKQGTITEARVDESVTRILEKKFKLLNAI